MCGIQREVDFINVLQAIVAQRHKRATVTQLRALPCYQREEMNILRNNNSFPRVGNEPTTAPTTDSHLKLFQYKITCRCNKFARLGVR